MAWRRELRGLTLGELPCHVKLGLIARYRIIA